MSKTPTWRRKPAPAGGFTLIEVMVVVAIVGILATIAYPSFMDAVRKSRRSDAFAALSTVQQAQERWRGNNSSYTGQLTALPTATPAGLGLSATSSKGYYTIGIDAPGATGYSALAEAKAGTTQASDANCKRLRVRVDMGNIFYGSAGATGAFDETDAARCWAR